MYSITSSILKYLIRIIVVVTIVYIAILVKAWNCDRVGMDYDIFIQGCVVRGVK